LRAGVVCQGCFFEVKGGFGEPFEDVAGDVAFERPHRFALGLSLFDAAVEVGARLGLVLGADERDGVDGVVDLGGHRRG
jgi:hypothetical protein